jgi:hypothetical protein
VAVKAAQNPKGIKNRSNQSVSLEQPWLIDHLTPELWWESQVSSYPHARFANRMLRAGHKRSLLVTNRLKDFRARHFNAFSLPAELSA